MLVFRLPLTLLNCRDSGHYSPLQFLKNAVPFPAAALQFPRAAKVAAMSFEGDLEHLPIVDVIQLLHATGKSGTLTLRSSKGESQLVFHGGYIVSANHVNNSVRIGQILLDMGMISQEELESALHEQQKAGHLRKPIIQTMIEGGRIRTDDAYQGLEVLIEMTIVEILTWNKGTFSLDVNRIHVSDEYRYFQEQLEKEIQVDTQNVLMDALRIYDERKRDGTLTTESMFGKTAEAAPPRDLEISVEDLGLDELDQIERKIHHPFAGLEAAEPETPQSRLKRELAGLPPQERQQLIDYLEEARQKQSAADGNGIILLSKDRLVREWVAAVSGSRFLCATDDPASIDAIVDQTLSKGRKPVLVVDAGEPGGRRAESEIVGGLQQKMERYPGLPIHLLTSPGDFSLTNHALQAGIRWVIPRSSREQRPGTLVTDTIDCSRTLEESLNSMPPPQPVQATAQLSAQADLSSMKQQFLALSEQREPSDITFSLLQAVAATMRRGVTLVLVRSELIAERSIGVTAPGATSSLKLRIPVSADSVLSRVLAGEAYWGEGDRELAESVYTAIPPPASHQVLLLPVKSFGRVIAIIYGDFGSRDEAVLHPERLELLALHAGLAIDNALYRKRCAQKG
jgi:hypothetical protein